MVHSGTLTIRCARLGCTAEVRASIKQDSGSWTDWVGVFEDHPLTTVQYRQRTYDTYNPFSSRNDEITFQVRSTCKFCDDAIVFTQGKEGGSTGSFENSHSCPCMNSILEVSSHYGSANYAVVGFSVFFGAALGVISGGALASAGAVLAGTASTAAVLGVTAVEASALVLGVTAGVASGISSVQSGDFAVVLAFNAQWESGGQRDPRELERGDRPCVDGGQPQKASVATATEDGTVAVTKDSAAKLFDGEPCPSQLPDVEWRGDDAHQTLSAKLQNVSALEREAMRRRVESGEFDRGLEPLELNLISFAPAIAIARRVFLGAATTEAALLAMNPGQLRHIFRDAVGHLNPTTKASMQHCFRLFKDIMSPKYRNDFGLKRNAVKANVRQYRKMMPDGKAQIWVQTRDGKIINGGRNVIHDRAFDPKAVGR